jgi:glycosyltransferase involved in cell wall biosynthesis
VLIVVGSGSGEYYDSVEAVLNQSKNIVLRFPTQEVENLAEFYQAADLAIWPGACSLSFFDAQACALPVIAERISSNEERIQPDFGNGALFTPDDVDALRDAIGHFYRMDRSGLKAMGTKGLNIIREKYDYDKVTLAVEALMEETIRKWKADRSIY